jgi:hypothetical protein
MDDRRFREGAVRGEGRRTVDVPRARAVPRALAGEIMTRWATGQRDRASDLLDRHAVVAPTLARTLATLDGVPVDVAPEPSSLG